MSSDIDKLNLIDLISERHVELRKIAEDSWNESSEIYISNSEWFIMVRIYYNNHATTSFVTKNVDISRQATHKFIKQLENKGLVESYNIETNKKVKGLRLTELGVACFEKYESVKEGIEKKIADQIGADKMAIFKEILRADWKL